MSPSFRVIVITSALVFAHFSSIGQRVEQELETLFQKGLSYNRRNQADSLLYTSRQIALISEELNISKGRAQAKILMGAYYQRYRLRHDSAKMELASAVELLRAEPDHKRRLDYGVAMLWLSRTTIALGQYVLAREYGNEALAAFNALGNDLYVGAALENLGNANLLQQKYAEALKFYLETRRHNLRSADSLVRDNYILLMNLAHVYGVLGQYDEALAQVRRSVAIQRRRGGAPFLPNAFKIPASIHEKAGNYDSAIILFRKAANLQKKNPTDYRFTLYEIANVYSKKGDVTTSEIYLDSMQKISPFEGEPSPIMLGMRNAISQKRHQDCIQLGRSIFRFYDIDDDNAMTPELLMLLAVAYEKINKYDSSYFFQRRANELQEHYVHAVDQQEFAQLYAEMEGLTYEKEIQVLTAQKSIDASNKQLLQLTLGYGLFITISLIGIIAVYARYRDHKNKVAELAIKEELAQHTFSLQHQTLRIIHISHNLSSIKRKLKAAREAGPDTYKKIQEILESIFPQTSLDAEWEKFDFYFQLAYPNFLRGLHSRVPNLTVPEIRLACLIRLKLTNQQLSGLLDIETNSLKTARYRLKRKLDVPKEIDLDQFLSELS